MEKPSSKSFSFNSSGTTREKSKPFGSREIPVYNTEKDETDAKAFEQKQVNSFNDKTTKVEEKSFNQKEVPTYDSEKDNCSCNEESPFSQSEIDFSQAKIVCAPATSGTRFDYLPYFQAILVQIEDLLDG